MTTTTVLLIRHESRGANEEAVPLNCLTEAARKRAYRSGQRLAELGFQITAAYSSPQFRAIETLQWNLAGNRSGKGPIPLNGVDPAFGDMYVGLFPFSEEEKTQVMADAKAADISPEEALVTLPQYAERAEDRGDEGGNALWKLVYEHEGGVIAIASHGGSRIEPIIMALWPNDDVLMVPPGGIAVFTFSDSAECVDVAYRGNLGLEPEPLTLETGPLDHDLPSSFTNR